MKKIILTACILTGGLMLSNEAKADGGVPKGTTQPTPNSAGGTNYSCPYSENICTTNTRNANGSLTIVIYLYENGNLTGTKVVNTQSGTQANPYTPNPSMGYIHSVETTVGTVWGKATASN
jgi:hypothetical protein